ncbi:Zn-dependent hydrolase [Leptolyngbya sp. FACHB-261]|uniref:Zn-dependent hydrolase n=1 Tax=Leptolyngbya sp. FACHB-261 TaxID=2692806 RepID=UPI0016830238|nr:Zn-dependent hydrolase [Leptolyngbya sp. FACHB-261]MBD2099853.1 Zn-dependent hydrolase [Leptolyngbya sp. FACHB-261]
MTASLAPKINSERLNQSIADLAEIGRLPNGGIRRISYSSEDLQARQRVRDWMVEAGMTVRSDAAGNMIGTYAGRQAGLGALATGSHIDTVAVGGRYDGVLGVLAGIEVIRVLQDHAIRLLHPIEVIVFTDEEYSMIGCKAMAGTAVNDPERYRHRDGTPIQTCLARLDGDWSKLATAQRDRSEIAAYVELHVEQGGLLDGAGKQIGVVEGIVGQYRYAVTLIGRPNHAGTTPMNLRKDALVAAAQVVLAVNALATQTVGEQVATVGALNVSPNAVNIVPGQVDLKIDIRALSQAHLDQLVDTLKQQLAEIATATGTEITITPILQAAPTLAEPKIQAAIVQACQQLGLTYAHLPSGAGHDAQEIGHFTDMGMIFVPSLAGISHAEDEYTSPEQCSQGASVLLQTLLLLDALY